MTDTLSSSTSSVGPAFYTACQGLKSNGGSPRVTLRLTEKEHARLMNMAGNMSVSAYVRDRLFGEAASPRKRHQRVPIKGQETLAQVLELLGQSHMASNLNQLARHANCGTLDIGDHKRDPDGLRSDRMDQGQTYRDCVRG